MFPTIMSVTYIRLYHTTDVKLSLWRSGAGDARINISPMQKEPPAQATLWLKKLKFSEFTELILQSFNTIHQLKHRIL